MNKDLLRKKIHAVARLKEAFYHGHCGAHWEDLPKISLGSLPLFVFTIPDFMHICHMDSDQVIDMLKSNSWPIECVDKIYFEMGISFIPMEDFDYNNIDWYIRIIANKFLRKYQKEIGDEDDITMPFEALCHVSLGVADDWNSDISAMPAAEKLIMLITSDVDDLYSFWAKVQKNSLQRTGKYSVESMDLYDYLKDFTRGAHD